MAGVTLRDYQEDAVKRMKIGCILNGGVGSGKSRTAIAYYYTLYGGQVNTPNYIRMVNPPDLYIITTAHKRDLFEWEGELANFYMSTDPKVNKYTNKIVVDSWNNIKKYVGVKNSFFIFDEQRLVGYGAWVHSFFKIAAANKWILLSATPGDTWSDYMPVFIANGFFKNKTDFQKKHVVFSPYTKFPSVLKYVNQGPLIRMRKEILVDMDFKRKTVPHYENMMVAYDRNLYELVERKRWNVYEKRPIENASEYCYILHRIVNSDPDRLNLIKQIMQIHPKVIIFYNYDYELAILRTLETVCPNIGEWNGHKHDSLPTGDSWVYLVQYTAGCEGWNCITTDTIIFYSQNYSYKVMQQAAGRIDRVNTPFIDLYYYYLKSTSKIDRAVSAALARKKKFNEKDFYPVKEIEKNPIYVQQHLDLDFSKKNAEKPYVDVAGMCEVHNSWDNPLK
jgi:hypothetical protein